MYASLSLHSGLQTALSPLRLCWRPLTLLQRFGPVGDSSTTQLSPGAGVRTALSSLEDFRPGSPTGTGTRTPDYSHIHNNRNIDSPERELGRPLSSASSYAVGSKCGVRVSEIAEVRAPSYPRPVPLRKMGITSQNCNGEGKHCIFAVISR